MAPLPRELTVPDSTLQSARTFVRSLNVLLKYSRLYGLEHTRSVEGFKSAWKELEAAVLAAGERGLLMGASGSQLLLDGVPLESTPAERKFADLLTDAGVASVSFSPHVSREDLLAFVRSFMESAIKTSTLTQRLEANLGGRSGIRLNEIRFVAEDASYSEARVAAQLTVKTLGGDAGLVTDWLSSPEKMIQLIAAAEGSHGGPGGPETGGPGIGLGAGLGTGGGAASGSGIGTGGGGPYPSGSGDAAPGSGTGTGGPYAAGSGGAAEGSGSGTGGPYAAGSGGTAAGSGSGTGGSYAAGSGGASAGSGSGTGGPYAAGSGGSYAAGSGGAGSGGTAVGGAGAVGPGVGGTGTGGGVGGGVGSAVGAGAVPGGSGAGTGGVLGGSYVSGAPIANQAAISKLEEADLQSLLRLLVQFGEAQHAKTPQQNPDVWKHRMSALPPNAQITLRQALAGVAATSPSAKMDEATLLRLAEDLAIKFALDRFQRGEVRVNAVRQMLDRMGHELGTLRKLLKAREEKLANAGVNLESHADVLDRQFWAAVPESGKRQVLMSGEAWCIPPRNVQQYVEELLGRGESDAAGDILLQYASCVRNKDAEARKKAAIGLGQLAELYSKAASQRLQDALVQIGQQMAEERDVELQTLLSAAFVRLSQESAARRYYRAMQQALDSIAELENSKPSWAASLRPRLGVENRVADFIEEALTAETMPEGLIGVLMRIPQASAEQLGVRISRCARRTEREAIVDLAKSVGAPCARHLRETLKNEPLPKAAAAVGLLSRLDVFAVDEVLPERLKEGQRSFHDAVVRQLSTAGAPERGQVLANCIELIDPVILPLALDEIGMCGDPATAAKLLRLAEGDLLPETSDYLRVKAIEALGRMRAPAAAGHLRHFVEARKTFGWVYPEEIRMAAAQALMKLDPAWMQAFLPQCGLDASVMSLAPLDAIPERDFVRHRRYRRVRLPRNVPAVITSARGKYSSAISVLSLEGGLLSGDIQIPVGTEATLKIPAGLRSISMRAVVRFVRSHQAGFEMVGMNLEDRSKLRRLLVSLGDDRPARMDRSAEPPISE
jgi:PilZ domain